MKDLDRILCQRYVANGMDDLPKAARSIGLTPEAAETRLSDPEVLDYLTDLWEASGGANPGPQHVLPRVDWERFCQRYVEGSDANAAYRECFPGVPDESVWTLSRGLLANKRVQARVRYLLGQCVADHNVTAERAKREIFRVAFADPRKLVGEDGRFLRLQDLDDDIAACVSQYIVDKDGVVRIKLHPKNEMLKLAAQHFKLVGMDEAADVLADAFAEKLQAARKRVQDAKNV